MSKTTEELAREAGLLDVLLMAYFLNDFIAQLERFSQLAREEGAAEERARLLDVAREPVFWFEADQSAKGESIYNVRHSMMYSTRISDTEPAADTQNQIWPLYSAPINATAIREAALEKAAKICESASNRTSAAELIRALKENKNG